LHVWHVVLLIQWVAGRLVRVRTCTFVIVIDVTIVVSGLLHGVDGGLLSRSCKQIKLLRRGRCGLSSTHGALGVRTREARAHAMEPRQRRGGREYFLGIAQSRNTFIATSKIDRQHGVPFFDWPSFELVLGYVHSLSNAGPVSIAQGLSVLKAS
jgi:hypothetical protein